jgi:hypothetical protein
VRAVPPVPEPDPRVRLAAVVAPVLVLLLAAAALWLSPAEDRGVVNGKPRQGGAVGYIDHELATRMPEVLVLGSSYAWTNLDQRVLAEALGLLPREVLVLSVPNSVCSHWYATLQHRVYDASLHVPLVIVVSSLTGLLQAEPYTETSRNDLLAHLEPKERVLDRFVHRRSPLFEAFRRRKIELREHLLREVRDRSIAALLEVDPEEAVQRVFHHARMADGPDATGTALDEDLAANGIAPADSLLPELLRLATKEDTRLLFLRTPDAPWTPATRRDVVHQAAVAEVEAMVVRRGHEWLDLYDTRLQAKDFSNARHMSPEGAARFTALAGPHLRAVWEDVKARPGAGRPGQ